MGRTICIAVSFMLATVLAQANQCSSGGECPSDNKPQNTMSLLQTKLQTTPTLVDFSKESSTPCVLNERGMDSYCHIETNSRDMVRKWLPSHATVLEVGARYGSVSCVIAAMQKQSGKVVSVEPDFKIWDTLDNNLKKYACQVNVLKGVVGTTAVEVEEIGYSGFGTQSHAAGSKVTATTAPAHSLTQVEKDFNMHFDTLIVDCEGCFTTLLRENPKLPQQMGMIIVETHADTSEEQSVAELLKSGFEVVAQEGRQRVLKRVHRVPVQQIHMRQQ